MGFRRSVGVNRCAADRVRVYPAERGCQSLPCVTVTLIGEYREYSVWYTMSMGSYDAEEHERRERKNSSVDASFDDDRTVYHGSVNYESDDSTEELLETFKEINSD